MIFVYPTRGDIDVIHLSRDDGPQTRAWKADGFKDEKPCAPDVWYEEFDGFLRHVLEYIDDDARWVDVSTDAHTNPFDAIKLLVTDPQENK